MGRPIPARVLAPAALAAFALVLVIVIAVSVGGSGGRPVASDTAARHSARVHRRRRFYTVRRGQTLSAISGRTGVPIERLQALNPQLDPQMLRPGQRLRLRR
jgi:spore germination protein YaaH